MKPRLPRPSILLLVLLLLAACEEPAPRHTVRLAEFDFGEQQWDPVYGRVCGPDRGRHWFADGWYVPKGSGLWTVGEASTVHLEARGTEARLRLILSTSKELQRKGQTLALEWNGERLARVVLSPNWGRDTCEVDIPERMLIQGMNRLRLLPSLWRPRTQEGGDQPWGVFVRRLELTAQLDAEQERRWRENDRPLDPPPEFAPVTLPAVRRPPREPDPDQPDVLMLVLGGVGAAHLGGYGYGGGTTPHLDALAEEGVLLNRLFSESPLALGSAATLFSGRSWTDRGLLRPGHALPEELLTMAEILQGAGYATMAFSDEPILSRTDGFAQGFDEFEEVWRRPERGEAGPEISERLLRARLARGLPDAPVFLYVQLAPPPLAEHADRERRVALYDEELRVRDQITGRMVRRWNELDRARPRLSVILADRGLDLGERGEPGGALYDETLRVPLLLHPADHARELGRSRNELRSLADVLPLLLHVLELPLPGATRWPMLTLTLVEDPGATRPAVLSRTQEPVFGLRGADTLAILRMWSQQELYDLHRDPGARENLRLQQPRLWLERSRRLRGLLESTAPAVSGEGE